MKDFKVQVVGGVPTPSRIPKFEYRLAAACLGRNIQRALEDPAQKADFENWKRRRAEAKEAEACDI